MTSGPKPRDSGTSSGASSKRKRRTRPTPRWLSGSTELDAIAQRRCLMILNVLSGVTPVSEAIEEHQLSRQMYYLLETRALNAMLAALVPGSETSSSDPSASAPHKRIAELEEKVKRLEEHKRRGAHLLFLTKQVLSSGPLKVGKGGRRPSSPKPETSSKIAGRAPSARSSPKRTSARRPTSGTTAGPTTSTASPTPGGEVALSGGSAS